VENFRGIPLDIGSRAEFPLAEILFEQVRKLSWVHE
jgi:hypothetical protein